MSLVEWDEELVLGIELIDSHHRHLVELLNKAHDSYLFGMKAGELEVIFNELVDYAKYHFAAEEALMKTYGYPETETHMAEHQAFIMQVVEMRKAQSSDKLASYLNITDFLLAWLITHIKNIDKLCCGFLASKGLQVKAEVA